MKLIIQIPCYNEAETLPETLADLPRHIDGIDIIETLVIDDGSEDETTAVSRAHGVTHIVSHPRNQGLARAFQTGLATCLSLGADIIVHTDADHQYPGRYIHDLVTPILDHKADIVIGNRQIQQIEHFTPLKKLLQQLGSWTVRTVSGTEVVDTTSGFRAYSREAALRLNILTRFSYTLETIIQAGKSGLIVQNIPIETNPPKRPSRLHRGNWHFVKSQAITILRLYAFYEPLRTFIYLSIPFFLLGAGSWLRFLYFFFTNQNPNGHIQSLIIGTGLLVISAIVFLFGVQADISSKHRQLTQETLYRLKKMEAEQQAANLQE
ncbi:MAG: glycosyltransferase family 2 protein [Chloroflexota bacterium]